MEEIGKNLRRIRLLRNMSLREVSDKMGISPTAISKYEKGIIIPDSKKIITFADIYNVKTIDILSIYDKPNMEFTSFRKRKRLSGKKLELLKEIIENEVSKYLEVIELNYITNTTISLKKYICNSLEDAEKAAFAFRKTIGISNNQPLSDLINTLENLGIVIIQIKDENNNFSDFDGLSEVVNNIPLIVILDNIKDGARQRFTIAHELGHLLLNIDNQLVNEEKMCNRFASALLMPKNAVYNEFGTSRNNLNIFELKAFKEEYKVSYSAIVYRLKDLDIISEYLYKKLNIYLNKYIGKNDPEPINKEKSNLFKKIVYRLEADNIISYTKACELLGEFELENYRKDNNNGY